MTTHVPNPIRGLLIALVLDEWSPEMQLGGVERLRYNGVDLTEFGPRVELHANRLKVTVAGMGLHRRDPFAADGRVDGVLAGNVSFHGDTILHVGRQGGFSQEHGPHASATIELAQWTFLQGEPPSLWVGRVEGSIKLPLGGNLIVERVVANGIRMGARRHFFFEGKYHYYLVQRGQDVVWHLLIDTSGAGMPDREAMNRDFLALQFVLGRQLRIPTLFGVDSDRHSVAWTTGCSTRTNLEERAVPPVPMVRNNDKWIDEAWPVVFFAHLSATWHAWPAERDAFWLALEMYLDAMTNHLDSDYTRLHIALEAFSYWLLQQATKEDRVDVKDKNAWKRWVKENEGVIRAHAVQGREDALYNKVVGAYRLSAGKVVPTAFAAKGLALTTEMVDELEGRNTVVHQGLMSPDGYDLERDLLRVALVRTMLVALIAKVVGYGGAINGWNIGAAGYAVEPSEWWSVAEDARRSARRTFVADEVASSS